jgi:hypothetical protein
VIGGELKAADSKGSCPLSSAVWLSAMTGRAVGSARRAAHGACLRDIKRNIRTVHIPTIFLHLRRHVLNQRALLLKKARRRVDAPRHLDKVPLETADAVRGDHKLRIYDQRHVKRKSGYSAHLDPE